MLFNSPVYIFLFLPLVVFVYFVLNRQRLIYVSKVWLVLASLFFYGYWNPAYLFLIITSMLVNFGLGRALHQSKKNNQTGDRATLKHKTVLMVGIIFNLGLLGYFKYADFFIENINAFFDSGVPALGLILPLAISFFTFQQIAYLVDSYQTDTLEYDFLNYCLFVTFFPQLIAGPIVHHKQMMPQFMRLKNSRVNWNNIAAGFFIFSLGLFKKVVIADSFAVWANAGFNSKQALNFFEAWGTSFSYTFQLYYDFSGYSDMAIGAALFFNIRLPVNFNSPYKAVNIQDFWQRWHISLSTWLRDYVYIPLGGNRAGEFRSYQNVMVTFLLGGLWHGAGWTFIAWGAMHGLALTVHREWRRFGLKLPFYLGWFFTFMFVNLTWVFFRAETFVDAVRVFKGMGGLNGVRFSQRFADAFNYLTNWKYIMLPGFNGEFLIPIEMFEYAIVFALIAFLMPNSVQMISFVAYKGRLLFAPSMKMAILTAVIFYFAVMTFIGNAEPSEFLYFNF